MDLATIPPVAVSRTAVRLESPGAVRRVGFILLSTDLTTERDAALLLGPEAIAVHACRVAFDNPTTPVNLRRMIPQLTDAAALLVPGGELAAVCFSCTSGTIEIGVEAIAAAIHAARPGVPIITPPQALIAALSALGARRIALLTPYLTETTQPMVAHFAGMGVDVVAAQCLELGDDRDMARVTRQTIVAAAVEADHPSAEALLISCTALPALETIAEIEERIAKPVVSSNQACLWQLLGHAGFAGAVGGYGRLLAIPSPGAGRAAAV